MYCKNCGRELNNGALFCKYCGSKVEADLRSESVDDKWQNKDAIKPSNNEKMSNKTIAIIISGGVVAMLIIAALVFVILFFVNNKSSDNNNNNYSNNNSSANSSYSNTTNGTSSNSSNVNATSSYSNISNNSDYILAGSDKRVISRDELTKLTQDQVRMACNELYARHGRKFQDAGIQSYFNQKSWYRGTIEPDAFDEAVFNEYEKKNKDIIVMYEKEMHFNEHEWMN